MAKWGKDKTSIIYDSYEEFVEIQKGRMKDTERFDPRAEKHIRHDLKRLYKHIKKGDRVLDAGCRDGWAIGRMAHDGYAGAVGIDVVPENVAVCKRLGFEAIESDCENLKFENGSFDAVFCRHTLEHVIDPRRAMEEFVRVTREGGVIHIVIPIETSAEHREIRFGHSTVFESSQQFRDIVSDLPVEMLMEKDCEKTASGIASTFIMRRVG